MPAVHGMAAAAGEIVGAAAAGDSGDAAVSCGLPDGSHAFILSDGMGKGMKAAAESRTVINGLRRMLRDGQPAAKAIEEVNRQLIGKKLRQESFATVDLTIIDKEKATADFYKMGAAKSFVLREGRIRRIERPALPVGIVAELKFSHVRVRLKPGDRIIMVSDGITEADRGDLEASWLEDFLRDNAASLGARTLASGIVAAARDKYGARETDDLTAVVVIIE